MTCHNTDSGATGSNPLKSDQMVPDPMVLSSAAEAITAETKTSDKSSSKFSKERETSVNADAGDLTGGSHCEKECAKSSMPLQVDEFGRIVREGVSDTDSDDSHFTRRHGRRGRISTRSPSQSPVNNMKRRRSPFRRRERSRERSSWSRRSPRRKRSWSRSPLRRTGFRQSGRRQHQSEAGYSLRTEQDQDTALRISTEHDGVKGGEIEVQQDRPSYSHFASTGAVHDEKRRAESIYSSGLPSLSGHRGDALVTIENENASLKELIPSSLRESDSSSVLDLTKDQLHERGASTRSHQGLDNHDQSRELIPPVSVSPFPVSVPSHLVTQVEAQLTKKCDESVSQKVVAGLDSFSADLPYHVSEASPLPPPPLQGASITSSNTYVHSQRYCYPATWNNLQSQQHFPPYANPSMAGTSVPFQLHEMTARKDSVDPTLPRLNPFDQSSQSSQSQNGLRQSQAFANHHRPLMSVEDFRHTVFHSGNSLSRLTEGPTGLSSSSYAQQNTLSGPVTLQNQSLTDRPCQIASDSVPIKAGGLVSLPKYSSEPLSMNNSSYSSDLGFKITPHYNPYASTFDQDLSSKFCSISHRQEETHYGSKRVNSLVGHMEVRGGASQMVASPHSSLAGNQGVTRSSGDQYDPLFDSIEPPSSASFKKVSHQLDGAADSSDAMLKLSDARKLTHVEGNDISKNTVAGGDANSIENDGSDETDDGAISETPSDNEGDKPVAGPQSDHIKKDRKNKETKDSRSMKLFKAELARFVKEVLKPSWRQGNMSKESFKTIVKKTVEKVSGAMRGKRVPKSKIKINQYITSSHRKLTQLVEGYVNKYAKA